MCTFPSQSYWFPSCLHACNCNNLKYVKTKWIKTIKESHIWRAERQDLFCPADSLKRHLTVIFKPKSQTSTLINLPNEQMGFCLSSAGRFAFKSLVMFSISSNFLQTMKGGRKKTQTAAQRANAFEMEHFLQNNESAESAVYTVMTKLLVHIRFVCHIYQTLMRERSEGQTPHDASQSRI